MPLYIRFLAVLVYLRLHLLWVFLYLSKIFVKNILIYACVSEIR